MFEKDTLYPRFPRTAFSSSALEAPKRRRKHPTIGGGRKREREREREKLRKGKERKRGRCKAHSSISLSLSLSYFLFPPLPPLEISPHTYARNIQRSVAALGGFNPSKLIPFSRSIAHSLCFVLHQLGYAQLPLFHPFPSIYSPPKSSFPFLHSFSLSLSLSLSLLFNPLRHPLVRMFHHLEFSALPNLLLPSFLPSFPVLCATLPSNGYTSPRSARRAQTHPHLSRPSTPSKSYTRAGLQGIVNCSCSANLHKSILNQPSSPRRVRRLAAPGPTTDV